jgi:membrane protein involved in colicin uptake
VEQARRLVRRRMDEPNGAPSGGAAADGKKDEGVLPTEVQTDIASMPRGADTNDLAEAARRDQAIAHQQVLLAQPQQGQQPSEAQRQQEEAQRAQRQLQHQEELQRHLAAMQQAAERRAEQEARDRERLIASLSPQELAQAAELQAQQSAVGALAFGSQPASEAAGLVHQANARRIAGEAAAAGVQVDVAQLVGMSPEALAEWDYEHDPYA